jgi:filamentous hemagglutinin family protein
MLGKSPIPWTVTLCSYCFGYAIAPSIAQGQIIPDRTLPIDSVVNPDGNLQTITGGTAAGANLFHSFREFSLPTGAEAFFNNASEISHIFTRVTGGNISNIDGLIRANGTASLFFLNPNGIIFGPNAQLNIGGSFFASSAESLVMADGSLFSATNPEAPPLLTVNLPVGLQFGRDPGAIVNQSQGTDNQGNAIGLATQPGQSLALIGGSLLLDGGKLTSPQGQIYLGSVGSNARVSLSGPDLGFAPGYAGVENFGDIQLTQNAVVNASGNGGGAIAVRGGNLTLTNGSSIISHTLGSENGSNITVDANQFVLNNGAFISASTFGSGDGGNLTLRATEQVNLSGTQRLVISEQILAGTFDPLNINSGLYALTASNGMAGDLTLETNQLIVNNGIGILASTFGPGNGGNLAIKADFIDITGGSLVMAGTAGTGSANNLTIDTRQLRVQDGSVVSSTTFGPGQGASVIVNAAEQVELVGAPANVLGRTFGVSRLITLLPTSILSGSVGREETGTGNAGDLIINTGRLIVRDGGSLSAASTSAGKGGTMLIDASESVEVVGVSGDGLLASSLLATSSGPTSEAGDIVINTGKLLVRDGGTIAAGTFFGPGAGGSVTVNASESIEVTGRRAGTLIPSGISASSGLAGSPIPASGAGGDVSIVTDKLIVSDGAQLAVSSVSLGDAGNLEVVAREIEVANTGEITGATSSGQGGNIRLQSQDLLLRQTGNINTNAANTNGGNIAIATENLVALENSDITANALAGRGGQVRINAQGIFGTEFRSFETPLSDITATSDLGPQFSGTVDINTPDIDAAGGLLHLDRDPIDFARLISKNLCDPGDTSQFTVTGRGGFPRSPSEVIDSPLVWDDLQFFGDRPNEVPRGSSQVESQSPLLSDDLPIVEAQGWLVKESGQVVLVAREAKLSRQRESPHVTPSGFGLRLPSCRGVRVQGSAIAEP